MSYNNLQANCERTDRSALVACFLMADVGEAIDWLKRQRTRLGWSTTDVAERAREVAALYDDDIKLTQQSISAFENGKVKSVPRWFTYAKTAVEAQFIAPALREKWIRDSLPWAEFDERLPEPATTQSEIAEQLDAVMIPEVQVGLSMGGGSAIEDWPVVQMVPFSRTWLRGLTTSTADQLMVARGDGDSMMPTILDQDLVIIDRAQNTPRQQDRIWALTYGGWGMIKRLRALPDGSLQINSDNANVSPIVAYEGEAQIIGRIVGVVRRI
jgi:phage repressor protein C with HTH and peptisase S24 domain